MRKNINTLKFIILHNLLKKKDVTLYYELLRNSDKSLEELQQEQDLRLKKVVAFAYENVTFYKTHFKNQGLIPSDIKSTKDLQYLPVINKSIIKNNPEDFIAKKAEGNFSWNSTGGSTGEPLKYLISISDQALGTALVYRGWNYGGYELGDPLLMLGGGSIVSTNITVRKKLYHKMKNHFIASSYGMNNDYLRSLLNIIHKKKIKFIRGYASSIFLLAEFINNNNIPVDQLESVKSLFTTAEMLYPQQRKIIEKTFSAKVYDGYGLNDGGISAFENGKQDGFLIDTERSVMESVDENGKAVYGQPGRIIATSLHNFHMPFLRYDTGDLGIISDEHIKNGGNRYLLKGLLGRATDYLELNSKKIGSPVLTVLMGKINAKQYQFIQKNKNTLEIRIDKEKSYSLKDEKFIRESLEGHVGKCEIKFIYGNKFIESENKHKFIIRDF